MLINNNFNLKLFFLENLIWFILIFMLVVFSIFINGFFSTSIFLNILQHSSVLGILVIGESLCLMSGHLDLSVESTMGVAAVVAGLLLTGTGINFMIAILVLLIIGGIIGLVNSYFIVKLEINPLIVTLSILIVLRGLCLILTGGKMLYNLPRGFRFIGATFIGKVPLSIIVLIILYFIFNILVKRKAYGKKLLAVGANRVAAKASGIKTKKIIVVSYIISGILAAFAGLVLSGRLNIIPPTLGEGMVMEVVAAAVIGGVSLDGGKGNVLGALGGVLLLGIISTALNMLDVTPYLVTAIRGAMIFVAVLLDTLKNKVILV